MANHARNGRATAGTIVAIVAVVAGVTLLAGSPGTRHHPTTATSAPASTSSSIDRSPAPAPPTTNPPFELTNRFTVRDDGIRVVQADASGAWYAQDGSSALTFSFGSSSGASTVEYRLPSPVDGATMAVHDGTLYVATTAGIVLIDRQGDHVSEPRAAGAGVVRIAFGVDRVWLVRRTNDDYTIEQWNTSLTTRVGTETIGASEPGGVLGVGGDVFVSTNFRGLLDLRPDHVQTVAHDGPELASALTMQAGLLLVVDRVGDLYRVDPATDRQVGDLAHVPPGATAIGADERSIVIVDDLARTVTQYDARSMRPVGHAALPGVPLSVAIANGEIWVAGDGFIASFTSIPVQG